MAYPFPMKSPIPNLLERIYAGVLGKVIGVYMGRPFEGWPKSRIEKELGLITGYVADRLGKPLMVSDDDITGTFTFIRALEDSGKWGETKSADFGRAWLNYLIENKTVLWWGGRGLSTEHTAWLNLKEGVSAPDSGSMARNGRVVAEQIGAQIFIDAIGLVTPGNPAKAAALAREAARVSHDGEAVHAAVVVAAMVSAAFTESRIDRLLDIGLSQIPNDSLVAQVHRDVRAWVAVDADWHRVYQRIDEKYGYRIYGGNCHVLPNHALMVLAWAAAGQDFHLAQTIVNTCGWDTDCNAANVGSVMGVALGIEGIQRSYDYMGPFADRILLPTADGTFGVTDCARLAAMIHRYAGRVMGWEPLEGGAAWHTFTLPGSRHGWMGERPDPKTDPAIQTANPAGHLEIRVGALTEGRPVRMSTPLVAHGDGGYSVMATAKIWPGMTVAFQGRADSVHGSVTIRPFLRLVPAPGTETPAVIYGQDQVLDSGKEFRIEMKVPDLGGRPPQDLGLEYTGARGAHAVLALDGVDATGPFHFHFDAPSNRDLAMPGWIHAVDRVTWGFSDDVEPLNRMVQNRGLGFLATGNRDWVDMSVRARLSRHNPGKVGLVARYQGLERNLLLIADGAKVELVERRDGETKVLGSSPLPWKLDDLKPFEMEIAGDQVVARVDGKEVAKGTTRLTCGGAGVAAEACLIGWRDLDVKGKMASGESLPK